MIYYVDFVVQDFEYFAENYMFDKNFFLYCMNSYY